MENVSSVSTAQGPKVRRLSAGEDWIRNFSSALPLVVSGVSENAIRAEQRVVSESVSPRRRRERIRTPVDRLRSKASSLVCRLESLGIPLKARILRESNGIEDGGTGSQSSPWINVRSRVSAQLVVAPGPWSPATRHHLAPPTNSPDRFRAGRSAAPSGSSRTRSHDTASAARSGS